MILMRVVSPCIFRHPNCHSMVLRRPPTSTICQVHEQRRRSGARFYRSNQPWGWTGVPHVSQSRLTSITKHQTHCSSLLHSSPILKSIVIALFFSFLGILGNKYFPPTVSRWHVGFVYCCFHFRFRNALQTSLCVVRTQWVGS